jgi:hypothetical protein
MAAHEQLPAMPSRTLFFRRFSTEHSWHKLGTPREFGITVEPGPRWVCHYVHNLTEEGGPLWIEDARLRQAALDNSMTMNGLVYGADHGFNITVEVGGDRFFEWLETHYPEDAAWVKGLCTRDDSVHWPWRVESSMFQEPFKTKIAQLKAKEYARLLDEFKDKAARVWAVYLETLKS